MKQLGNKLQRRNFSRFSHAYYTRVLITTLVDICCQNRCSVATDINFLPLPEIELLGQMFSDRILKIKLDYYTA